MHDAYRVPLGITVASALTQDYLHICCAKLPTPYLHVSTSIYSISPCFVNISSCQTTQYTGLVSCKRLERTAKWKMFGLCDQTDQFEGYCYSKGPKTAKSFLLPTM